MKEIILDLYGGDNDFEQLIPGAIDALKKNNELQLSIVVKKENMDLVENLTKSYDKHRINIIEAEQILTNYDNPMLAAIPGAGYTISKAFDYLANCSEKACVLTVGSTGAALILALSKIGLKPNATRPVLASLLPRMDGGMLCLLDCGANLEPTSQELFNYAVLGAECISEAYNISRPKVALLSVGKEKGKGPEVVKEAYQLLEDSNLNFVGNVEPDNLFTEDIDVVACNGFVGNMILKNTEATGVYLRNLYNKISQEQAVWDKLSYYYSFNDLGGAIVLGTKQQIIKAHGKANAGTILNCIEQGIKL